MSIRTDRARIAYPDATVFTRELVSALEGLTQEDFEILLKQEFKPLHEELFTPTRVSRRRDLEIACDVDLEMAGNDQPSHSILHGMAMRGLNRMYEVVTPISEAHFRRCMAAGHWD